MFRLSPQHDGNVGAQQDGDEKTSHGLDFANAKSVSQDGKPLDFASCATTANPCGNYFDFREFLSQFSFSAEAKSLYAAALEIFRFYHHSPDYAAGRDWNDSFYDITNAIMGKNAADFQGLDAENDTRISKTKTTKGTRGFGRNTIKSAVRSEFLPIFYDFFDKRDILARKINRELLDAHLLLWGRENIY